MKKKLSRLLCALLVMTMVLAMVPAVSAAGPDGSSADQAIVLYKGQKTPTGYSCDESGHTCTAKFYENFGIKETETSTRYVTYDTKTGQFTASAATYKNGTWGYVKAVVTCKGKGCTTAPQEVYMKVYDVAKGVTLKDGSDVAIIANGLMVYEAIVAAQALAAQGIDAMVINMATIKPLDEELVLSAAKKCGKILTVEEHNIIGGLGEAVCSCLSEKYPVPVKRVGVNDEFGHSGPAGALLKAFGLCADNIVAQTKALLGK